MTPVKTKKKPSKGSDLEAAFHQALLDAGMGAGLVREFQFHPRRLWKVDFAYPTERLLIEIEGGIWVQGRHTRGAGYEEDCEKYDEAVIHHYRLLRFTSGMIKSGKAIDMVRRARKWLTTT